jgi:hypothetical protein
MAADTQMTTDEPFKYDCWCSIEKKILAVSLKGLAAKTN